MSPSEMTERLEGKHNDTSAALTRLEIERMNLMPAFLADDPAAVKRMKALRSEIQTGQATLRDLVQAIVDLRPALVAQQRAENRATRIAAAKAMSGALERIDGIGARIDAAVDGLVAAFNEAEPCIAHARDAYAALTVQPGADMASVALYRMLAEATGSGFHRLPEILMARLASLGVTPLWPYEGRSPKTASVAHSLAVAKSQMETRVAGVIAELEAEHARLALPAPEPVAA